MVYAIDKNYSFPMSNITAGVTASGLPMVEGANRFSVQVNPTITGSPTALTAVIDGSNDGVNWFQASTTSGGSMLNQQPQLFQVTDNGAGQYRLKITCAGTGGANITAYVVSKRDLP